LPKIPNWVERLASFLQDITLAWEEAGHEQRNRLVSQLFKVVRIENKQLMAVIPRPEFKPFFDLEYQAVPECVVHIRHRRGTSAPLNKKFPFFCTGEACPEPVEGGIKGMRSYLYQITLLC